jgi:hypothetical protein
VLSLGFFSELAFPFVGDVDFMANLLFVNSEPTIHSSQHSLVSKKYTRKFFFVPSKHSINESPDNLGQIELL